VQEAVSRTTVLRDALGQLHGQLEELRDDHKQLQVWVCLCAAGAHPDAIAGGEHVMGPRWRCRVALRAPLCCCCWLLQESHRALMTKDLMNSGLLRDRYVADLFGRLQVSSGWPGACGPSLVWPVRAA
jgi:hypothetical protein